MNRTIIFIFLVVLSFFAQAKTRVIFFNGINNTPEDELAAETKLKEVISSYWASDRIASGKISVEHWDNPGDGLFEDINELSAQARLSYAAMQCAAVANGNTGVGGEDYNVCLGNMYRSRATLSNQTPAQQRIYSVTLKFSLQLMGALQTDDDFIIVTHSQGNYVSEAVNAYLRVINPLNASLLSKKVRFVGVASVASSTPNGKYLSLADDEALSIHETQRFPLFLPNIFPILPRTHALCPDTTGPSDTCHRVIFGADLNAHSFTKIYLSNFSFQLPFPVKKYVSDMVRDSYFELHPEYDKLSLINPSNNHRYELITCGTWSLCRDAAIAKGGNLVTIRNQAENDWLTTTLIQQAKPDFAVWIGFTDAGHEGNWTWASGEVKPYSNWYPGEPNNSGNVENYAIIYNSGEYKDKWNDVQNDYPYVTKAVVEYPSSVPSSSTWNAVADYSLALNPNGAWSYGYQSQTSSIAPMLVTNVNCADIGMDCWKISALAPDIPMVAINRSGATIVKRTVVVPTGVLVLHPGMNGERAVVSWTAPTDGNYKIVGQFDIVDVIPSGVQVFVTEDATQLISANLSRRLMSQQINLTRTLIKGQIISFSVDSAGNYGNDSTSLSVTITKSVGGGAITVLANTIPGATVTVPSGASSCSFVSTGTWSAGPQAPPQYQNADGVIGGTSYNLTNFGVPIPSAPNMALVVKHSSSGNWDLLGSNKTISVVAGETLSFMMNDATTFGYTDGNTGQLSTVWSCN